MESLGKEMAVPTAGPRLALNKAASSEREQAEASQPAACDDAQSISAQPFRQIFQSLTSSVNFEESFKEGSLSLSKNPPDLRSTILDHETSMVPNAACSRACIHH